MQCRFSRRAEIDLEEIGDFIAANNPDRALSFVEEIRTHCRALTTFPTAHPLRPEFGNGVRLSLHGRYQIFYVAHGNLLEIRRVLHGARDLRESLP